MSSSPVLAEILAELRKYKALAEGAMSQINDEELFRTLDPEGNSVALIVKHMRGNMRSRWRDFLTTDGEKPDRDRDSEFVRAGEDRREVVLDWWEEGWREAFSTIEALHPDDLVRTVTTRGEPQSVLQALLRQLTHYSYHVGQIVFLAKHFRGAAWNSLSIPRRRDSPSLLRERLAAEPAALPFAEAVVAQLTGPTGPLHDAPSADRDRLAERVAALVLGAGGENDHALGEQLRVDHALTAAFFQNIDLLYVHDYARADAVGHLVMHVLHGWHPESTREEEP